MYEIRHAYDSLQVAEEKPGELSLEARLRAINRPLLDWYRNHARILPWREDPKPYHVWISEIMLQQLQNRLPQQQQQIWMLSSLKNGIWILSSQ